MDNMNKNPVWLGMLAIMLVAFCIFAFIAFYQLHTYYSLSEKTNPSKIEWFVEELSSDDFRVGATYSYVIKDQEYTGETIFRDKRFRNPMTADDEWKLKSAKISDVFYNPANPSESSLEKHFPVKNLLYASFLFLLFLYFLGLGIYTGAFRS